MKPRLLVVLACLPCLALLLQAADPPPNPEPIGLPPVVSRNSQPEHDAKGRKRVCRMVDEQIFKKVPVTVCRMVPDGAGYKPVYHTTWKEISYTVRKPVYEYVDEAFPVPSVAEENNVGENPTPPAPSAEPAPADAEPTPPPFSKPLEDALSQLRLYPKNAYLQFVVLQLARREHRIDDVASTVEEITNNGWSRPAGRRDAVDLFSIFTGAVAVQESLQLDTMRGERRAQDQRVGEVIPGGQTGPIPPPIAEKPAQPSSNAEPKPIPPPPDPSEASGDSKPVPPPDDASSVPVPPWIAGEMESGPWTRFASEEWAAAHADIVAVNNLKGPTVKSHPWKKMLAGRTPAIEPLARMVPRDFYYVHFHSLTKLLESVDLVAQAGIHFDSQAYREAQTHATSERLQKQLVIGNGPVLGLFCDQDVEDVAIVGSDLFIHEGSDVTLLFHFQKSKVFHPWMDDYLESAYRSNADVDWSCDEYLGVPYEHLETPDREICVYSAYPADDIHIRSNSLTALKRVIEAFKGKTADGKRVVRLGDTAEFAYIRTLYPLGAAEEDGLIYLSDPFIRRLVGPQVKLTERRRMLCYNHLRMIGHAAMLYQTEHGSPPESIEALVEAGCLPESFERQTAPLTEEQIRQVLTEMNAGPFELQERILSELENSYPEVAQDLWKKAAANEMHYISRCLEIARSYNDPRGMYSNFLFSSHQEEMTEVLEQLLADVKPAEDCTCPDCGHYELSADGMTGICSHHGHAHFMTPNYEIPLAEVSIDEAAEYEAFRDNYNHYWRQYFDPIAIRVQVTPERFRLETLVLPLIDNSLYTGLAAVLGGTPENLDALPVPKRNIFSMNFRLNKEALLKVMQPEKVDADEEVNDDDPEADDAEEPSTAKPPVAYYDTFKALGISEKDVADLNATKFLQEGIGTQIGLHLYDAPPNFDFNLPTALGFLLATSAGSEAGDNIHAQLMDLSSTLLIGAVGATFNGPAYVSLAVKDATIVDEFGDRLERIFTKLSRQTDTMFHGFIGSDFYRVPFKSDPSRMMRVFTVRYGPVKLRYFWARIGNAVYIASQPCVLEDLLALENQHGASTDGEPAHALVKIRARNWHEVLENTYLGWAENHRLACVNNQGALSSVARAFTATLGKIDEKELAQVGERILQEAERLYQVHMFCPEGGHYVLSADGQQMTCTVHGSALEPRQPAAPNWNSPLGQQLDHFGGLTATLTFLKEGLQAVVTIERK